MKTSHFYPELSALYPQYPDLSFDRALNTAARSLCRIGLVWQEELFPVSWAKGESEYFLMLPQGARVVQLLTLSGMQAATPGQLSVMRADWREQSGEPTHYFRVGHESIRVYPTPAEDALDVVVPFAALSPTDEPKELSDRYAWDYERLLLMGAIAHLGGASWPAFEQLCHNARSRAVDNNHIGVARTVRYGGL